jgi:hypothetical protein
MKRGTSKSSIIPPVIGIPLLLLIYYLLWLTLHLLAGTFSVITEFFRIVDSLIEELLFLGCPIVIPPLIFLVLSLVCFSIFILASIDHWFHRR